MKQNVHPYNESMFAIFQLTKPYKVNFLYRFTDEFLKTMNISTNYGKIIGLESSETVYINFERSNDIFIAPISLLSSIFKLES